MEKIDYRIKSNSFELADVFDCGQCFRWNVENDGSYTGVFKKIVLNVKKIDDEVIFNGVNYGTTGSIEEINHYFDLNRNYDELKSKLEKIDDYMKNSIEFGKGIRILNQDLWETIISFIISANNNIPRIKGIIDRLSEKYGEKLEYNGREYYSFPEPIALKDVLVSEYRSLGLGFSSFSGSAHLVYYGENNLRLSASRGRLFAVCSRVRRNQRKESLPLIHVDFRRSCGLRRCGTDSRYGGASIHLCRTGGIRLPRNYCSPDRCNESDWLYLFRHLLRRYEVRRK